MQKINLFVSYYQCGNSERQKELDFCFNTNKDSGLFERIINFDNRPMYNDFFNQTQDYPNDINILANADIYFNQTINLVQCISKKSCYAITRSELKGENIVSFDEMHEYNRHAQARHSQDVWVFNGKVSGINGSFHLGIPGCDNRIAHEIITAGYNCTNPSDKIQCIHKHKSQNRNYNIPAGYHGGRVPHPYKFVPVNGENTTKKRFRL